MSHLLQHGQHRINHPGTWCIRAAQPFLDRLDDLVPVARLLRNVLQNHVAQITHAKQPHRPASATAKSTPSFTNLAESSMPTVVSVPATTAKAVPVSIVPMSLS